MANQQCRYLIGTTILSELLTSSPLLHNKESPHDALPPHLYGQHAPRDLQHAGAHLAQYQPDANREVVFIAYSPPGHWAAISVTSKGTLEWADSLRRHAPSTLVTGVQTWLRYHLSSSSFTLGNSFLCSRQTDGHSCGIIALNAIRHRIFGDALWSEKNRSQLRIREFLDIMQQCNKVGGQKVCFRIFIQATYIRLTTFQEHVQVSLGVDDYPLGPITELPLCAIDFSSPLVSSYPLPPITTLDATDLSSDCTSSSEFASSTTLLVEEDELCSSSPSRPPSPATTAMPVKGGLHSYFSTVHTGGEAFIRPIGTTLAALSKTHAHTANAYYGDHIF